MLLVVVYKQPQSLICLKPEFELTAFSIKEITKLSRNTQKATAITLALLVSTLLLAAFSAATAQTTDQAVIVILPSAGGTSDPAPGNYTYNSGDVFNMTAIADDGFQFSYWIISGAYTPGHTNAGVGYITDPDTGAIIQLPTPISTSAIDSLVVTNSQLNITCGFGYTYNYQAVFAPTSGTPSTTPAPQTSPATSNQQGVIILASIGGTTSPAPGSYMYDSSSPLTLMATPNQDFTFHYWIVSGSYTPGHLSQPQYIPGVTDQYPIVPSNIYYPTQDSLVFAANPATITCGYGYTYTYQAIFDPVNATTPTIPLTTPSATQTPTTTTTPVTTPVATVAPVVTPTPTSSSGISTTVIVAIVVVIIIIIIALVAVMMMRRKK